MQDGMTGKNTYNARAASRLEMKMKSVNDKTFIGTTTVNYVPFYLDL
jgi:hypothetical protein